MQIETKSTSRPSAVPPSRRGNAFSSWFQERARALEEPPFAREALFSGAWEVEAVATGAGEGARLWAVVRRGEPLAEGGRALAVFLRRPDALLAAAAFAGLARANRLTLNTDGPRQGAARRRLGCPLHDGSVHLGHLSRPEEDLLPLLHAVRSLAAAPEALALVVESLGPEVATLVGRALLRRVS
jgi:hypothetical protein